MGIAKKNKRKIIVDGVEYYWYIADDFEVVDLGTNKSLIVVSDDKRFLVHYPINQQHSGENHLVVVGKVFGGEGNWGACWQRVICPKWENKNKITPASVEQLVRWALSDKRNEFVDYKGVKLK